MQVNYINLTNGIEAIPDLPIGFHFIRIQSTMCEQQLWNQVLMGLDMDFLMNVALGNQCVIYDYGCKKPVSRAVFQGVEFIKFALYRRWKKETYHTEIWRHKEQSYGKDCTKWFDACYQKLERKTRHRLDFFLPYFRGSINIYAISAATRHDGDIDFYVQVLHKWQEEQEKRL